MLQIPVLLRRGGVRCWLANPSRFFHTRIANYQRVPPRSNVSGLKEQGEGVNQMIIETALERKTPGIGISNNIISQVKRVRPTREIPRDEVRSDSRSMFRDRVEALVELLTVSGRRRRDQDWRVSRNTIGSSRSSSAATRSTAANRRKLTTTFPTAHQLRCHFMNAMIPMVGFGFMDNLIMIQAGELIDTSLGVTFGLSTLTAAAVGQIFSDMSGACFGGVVSVLAGRLGLPSAALTPEQKHLDRVRAVGTTGRMLGVLVGCLLGMSSLLFMDLEKSQRLRRFKELQPIFATLAQQTRRSMGVKSCRIFLLGVDSKGDQEYFFDAGAPGDEPQHLNVVSFSNHFNHHREHTIGSTGLAIGGTREDTASTATAECSGGSFALLPSLSQEPAAAATAGASSSLLFWSPPVSSQSTSTAGNNVARPADKDLGFSGQSRVEGAVAVTCLAAEKGESGTALGSTTEERVPESGTVAGTSPEQCKIFETGGAASGEAELQDWRSNRSGTLPFGTANAWALLRCMSVGELLGASGGQKKKEAEGLPAETRTAKDCSRDSDARCASRLPSVCVHLLNSAEELESKGKDGRDEDDDDQPMVVVVEAGQSDKASSNCSEHAAVADGEGVEDVQIYCSRSGASSTVAAVWALQRGSTGEYSSAETAATSNAEAEATITMHDGGKVEPIIGYVSRTGKPVMCVQHRSVMGSGNPEQQQHRMGISRSLLCYPIFDDIDRDRVIGVIELVDKHTKDLNGTEHIDIFTREDERLVRMLSGHLSLYLALGSFYKHSGRENETGPMEKFRWICPPKSTSASSTASRSAPESQ